MSCELYGIVTGMERLSETDEKKKQDWISKDAYLIYNAQKFIITLSDKIPMMQIINYNTAKEMINKLCKIYERETDQQKCELLQETFNYKHQKGTDIASHVRLKI